MPFVLTAAAAINTTTASNTAAATTDPVPVVLAAPARTELNGMALMWAIISDWFRNLFSARKA